MDSYAQKRSLTQKKRGSLKVEPHKHSLDVKRQLRMLENSDEHSCNASQSNPIQPYRSGFSTLKTHSPVLS